MNATSGSHTTTLHPDGFLDESQAIARQTFGVPFDLWTRAEHWRCLGPADAATDTSLSARQTVVPIDVLDCCAKTGDPVVHPLSDGQYLVAIPIQQAGENSIVATGKLSGTPETFLQDWARLFAKGLAQDQPPPEPPDELESFVLQMGKDFEALTFLHGLADQFQSCDVSHSVAEVAEIVLPRLQQVINAEAVILVPALRANAPDDGSAMQVDAPSVWIGQPVLSPETCSELVQRWQAQANEHVIVKNRNRAGLGPADAQEIDLILVPVTKDACFTGWILAVKRPVELPTDDEGIDPHDETGDAEFGTAEAGLAKVAAIILAAHGRNVELFGAMSDAKTQAESASRSKSEFLANMNHEIRTPLNAVLGCADVLMGECEDNSSIEYLQMIKRNGQSLLQILSDILDLSRIEAGRLETKCIPCRPKSLLAEVKTLLHAQAEAKGLKFKTQCAGPIPEKIYTDPTRLRQILWNLIGNGVKFTEKGSVRIVARYDETEPMNPIMVFEIIDTGIGITADQLAGLFEPFVQIDGSMTRKFGGTGLGLAISQKLARILGGDITVSSTPGRGSLFRLSMPVGSAASASAADVSPAQQAIQPNSDRHEKRVPKDLHCRILLVEDCPDNQRLMSVVLDKAGAHVAVAENGKVAIESALAARECDAPFDVILMDMQMPVMDGYTATRRLRELGLPTAIIALTAQALSGDREKCIDAGCDDYISKPINRDRLIATVAAHQDERCVKTHSPT